MYLTISYHSVLFRGRLARPKGILELIQRFFDTGNSLTWINGGLACWLLEMKTYMDIEKMLHRLLSFSSYYFHFISCPTYFVLMVGCLSYVFPYLLHTLLIPITDFLLSLLSMCLVHEGPVSGTWYMLEVKTVT